jgi:hypothetical protein
MTDGGAEEKRRGPEAIARRVVLESQSLGQTPAIQRSAGAMLPQELLDLALDVGAISEEHAPRVLDPRYEHLLARGRACSSD